MYFALQLPIYAGTPPRSNVGTEVRRIAFGIGVELRVLSRLWDKANPTSESEAKRSKTILEKKAKTKVIYSTKDPDRRGSEHSLRALTPSGYVHKAKANAKASGEEKQTTFFMPVLCPSPYGTAPYGTARGARRGARRDITRGAGKSKGLGQGGTAEPVSAEPVILYLRTLDCLQQWKNLET